MPAADHHSNRPLRNLAVMVWSTEKVIFTYPIVVHLLHVFVHFVDLAHHAVTVLVRGTVHLLPERGKLGGVDNARWHLLGDAIALLQTPFVGGRGLLVGQDGQGILCELHISVEVVETLVVGPVLALCTGATSCCTYGEDVRVGTTSSATLL